MRYLIEQSVTGDFLIQYNASGFGENAEIEVEMVRQWPTDLITELESNEIEDTFGTNIEDFKQRIGKGVYLSGFPKNVWIRVNISNLM